MTDANNHVTQYGYDLESNLTSVTDANNHATGFTYDTLGRLTKTTFPSTKVETYSYDNVGNLMTKTDRKNQTISYGYDTLNRLISKTYPDSTSVTYTYDDASRLTQVQDPTGTYSFVFDNMGRLKQSTAAYSFVSGNPFSIVYGSRAESGAMDCQLLYRKPGALRCACCRWSGRGCRRRALECTHGIRTGPGRRRQSQRTVDGATP